MAKSRRARDYSSHAIARHHLEFEGSGHEYFKVWLVNVVLTVLTLGFYTPFARRRTAVYFYNHTLVADSALEFTGSIKRMLLGFLVVTTLYVLYELAGYLEYEWAVNFMLVLAALAAPFLWGSAMRFRTRSTRWRGIRPLFVASWREIYQQSWPIFAVALVWIAIVVGFNASGAGKALEVAQGMEQLEMQRDKLLDQLEGDDEEDGADDAAERLARRDQMASEVAGMHSSDLAFPEIVPAILPCVPSALEVQKRKVVCRSYLQYLERLKQGL